MQDGTWLVLWRLYDVAGNGPVLSEERTFSIDRTGVTFSSHSPTGWVITKDIVYSVRIEDLQSSGVDKATIEYSYSTDGLFSFTDWAALDMVGVEEYVLVEIPLSLSEGTDNFVQVRASDAVGNERTSKAFRIAIDATASRHDLAGQRQQLDVQGRHAKADAAHPA